MATTLFSKLSLRNQIALVFGIIVSVLVVSLAFVYAEALASQSRNDVAQSLHAIARSIERVLSDDLHERSREAKLLSQSRSLWRSDLGSIETTRALEQIQGFRRHTEWIGATDAAGTLRAATENLRMGHDSQQENWFKQGQKDAFVGNPHSDLLLNDIRASRRSAEPIQVIDFAAPLSMGEDNVQGVLIIQANWNLAQEIVNNMLPANAKEKNIQALIFDRAGKPILAPPGLMAQLLTQQQLAPASELAAMRISTGAPAGQVRWNDGKDYLTALALQEPRTTAVDLGWQIVVRQPVDQAWRASRDLIIRAIGWGLLLALVASLAAYAVAAHLGRDLRAMAKTMQAVEAKTLREVPHFSGSHEAMVLSKSLSGMTNSLLRANDDMEAQVQLRTQELQSALAALDKLAHSDPLTGLLNRRGLQAQFKSAQALAKRNQWPLSALMVDADHFKKINDTFGHDVGDDVLKFLAQTLTARLRDSDAVARMGGEEFVVLLPKTDSAGAVTIAQALVDQIAAHQDPVFGRITVSIGVAACQHGNTPLDDLLKQADEALYMAKQTGRNRVVAANS
jgi:diguanylate cyclase (GGDEF)-like protein